MPNPGSTPGTVVCGSLHEYQSALSRSLFPSRLVSAGRASAFRASAAVRRVGHLSIIKAHANAPVCVQRLVRVDDVRDDLVLHLQLSGRATYSHANGHVECPAGSLFLTRVSSVLAAEQHGPADAIVVRMPGEFVRSYIADADEICWTASRVGLGSAAILKNFILSVWAWCEDLQEQDHRFLPVSLVHLVQCAFRSETRQFARFDREPPFDRLQREISMRLHSGRLGVDDIARAIGVSRSKLYGITSLHGTTVERLIFDMRLDRVARALADETSAARSITDLAYDAGFRDLSHFCRRFKQKFRQSPTAYRALAAGRQANAG